MYSMQTSVFTLKIDLILEYLDYLPISFVVNAILLLQFKIILGDVAVAIHFIGFTNTKTQVKKILWEWC